MEKALQDQISYHVEEYLNLSKSSKVEYLQEYGITAKSSLRMSRVTQDTYLSENQVEKAFEDTLENAYIYTMDENGYVYDKEGDVINKIDLNIENSNQNAITNINNIKAQRLANTTIDSSINGYNSGAFSRQVTGSGYSGIKTTLTLPTATNISVANSSVIGYLYNGIDTVPTGAGGYKLEAGLQYSPATSGYTASIHPQNQSQNAVPDGPDANYSNTNLPKRYKPGTSITHNLIYDTSSSQFKYFVNGTNVNGTSQYIYFYYHKSLTSDQLNDMHVKRVAALAKEGYAGESIGKINLQYTDTQITNIAGTTVSLTSAKLDSLQKNGKIYGTADNPSGKITKTPTSGNIASQSITINAQ